MTGMIRSIPYPAAESREKSDGENMGGEEVKR